MATKEHLSALRGEITQAQLQVDRALVYGMMSDSYREADSWLKHLLNLYRDAGGSLSVTPRDQLMPGRRRKPKTALRLKHSGHNLKLVGPGHDDLGLVCVDEGRALVRKISTGEFIWVDLAS